MDNLLFYVSSAFVSLLLAWNLFACWRRQRPPEKSRPCARAHALPPASAP